MAVLPLCRTRPKQCKFYELVFTTSKDDKLSQTEQRLVANRSVRIRHVLSGTKERKKEGGGRREDGKEDKT